jgi:peptide/nickel transport system substrate-binding protein
VLIEFNEFYPRHYELFPSILPRHATGAPADMQEWDFNANPIGTGPFTMDEWIPGERISWAKNGRFRDYPFKPNADRIVSQFIDSIDEGKDLIRSGSIDILGNLSEHDVPEFQSESAIVIHVRGNSGEERLVLNLADPTLDSTPDPLNNPHWALGQQEVRQAIQYAIDKQAIVDQLLHGVPEVATSPLSTGWARCSITATQQNITQANALLDAAGWTDLDADGVRECHGCPYADEGAPLVLEINSTINQLREDTELMLVDMLSEISVTLTISNVHPSEIFGSWDSGAFSKRGDFDILMYTVSEIVDPHYSMVTSYYSSSMPTYDNGGVGWNLGRWVDKVADGAIDAAGATPDLAVRKGHYQTLCERIADDLPEIFLYERTIIYLTRDDIQNFRVNPLGSQTWNAAEWDRPGYEISAVIDPSGGELVSWDETTLWTFPAGAFSETVVVTDTSFAEILMTGDLLGIGYAHFLTAVYSDTGLPAGLAAGAHYTITTGYSDPEVGFASEETLAFYHWNAGRWELEPSSQVDTVADTVTATPDHLSLWAVLGETHRLFLPAILKGF